MFFTSNESSNLLLSNEYKTIYTKVHATMSNSGLKLSMRKCPPDPNSSHCVAGMNAAHLALSFKFFSRIVESLVVPTTSCAMHLPKEKACLQSCCLLLYSRARAISRSDWTSSSSSFPESTYVRRLLD